MDVVDGESQVYVGDENRGTVTVGDAVYTPIGPAVSWVSMPYSDGQPRHAGVALLLQGKVAGFVDTSPASQPPIPPPLFQRDNELDLLVPPLQYDHVIRVPMDTFVPSAPVPIPISSPDIPAVLGMGQTLAAVVDPGPHFLRVNSTLDQRFVDKLVDTGEQATITATCSVLLVTGTKHDATYAQPFDALGNQLGPVLDTQAGPVHAQPWDSTPVWDGASVVLPARNRVVELDSNGSPRDITPTPSDAAFSGIEGAFGTDEGVLATMGVNGLRVLRLLDRGTGTVLHDFGRVAGNVTIAGEGAVYFAGAGVYAQSTVNWTTVECSN